MRLLNDMYHLLPLSLSPCHCDEKIRPTHTGIPSAKRHVEALKHMYCFYNSKLNLLQCIFLEKYYSILP